MEIICVYSNSETNELCINVYNRVVVAHQSTEDSNRERLILLYLGVPTLFWFSRFKGKRTPDKILSPLFVIVNQSYIPTFYNNTGRYK